MRRLNPFLGLIEVVDTGEGIAAAELGRIFDRFYRIRGSGRSGSGLGLALVKEVVTWHGGCIRLDSTNGPGSTFRITLPVAPGRNLAIAVETAVRNHILLQKGYDAAEDFIQRQNSIVQKSMQ